MSPVTASFCLIVCFLVGSSEAEQNITAELGQNVTLPCKSDNNNKPITVVDWRRLGLNPEYVFLYRNGGFDPDNQHPSYKNRVYLKDREMKDGDVSLVLKNVKMEDKGRYNCRVVQGETGRTKNDPINTITLEVLPPGDKDGGDKDGGAKVGGDKDGGNEDGGDKDGGDEDGNTEKRVEDGGDKDGGDEDGGDKDGISRDGGTILGISLGVVGFLLLVVTLVGFLIYKRRNMRQNVNLPVPPDEAAAEQILTKVP